MDAILHIFDDWRARARDGCDHSNLLSNQHFTPLCALHYEPVDLVAWVENIPQWIKKSDHIYNEQLWLPTVQVIATVENRTGGTKTFIVDQKPRWDLRLFHPINTARNRQRLNSETLHMCQVDEMQLKQKTKLDAFLCSPCTDCEWTDKAQLWKMKIIYLQVKNFDSFSIATSNWKSA